MEEADRGRIGAVLAADAPTVLNGSVEAWAEVIRPRQATNRPSGGSQYTAIRIGIRIVLKVWQSLKSPPQLVGTVTPASSGAVAHGEIARSR